VGGGAGVEFPNILAGIEAVYLSNRLEEQVLEDTVESTSLNFKVGTEFGLISNLMGRAGYSYNEVDLSYEDSVYTLTTNTVTGGLGIDLPPRASIDISYNYKWTTVDLLPEEKITDHIVSLCFKYLMGVEGY
jgi:opacity protein-like surface antigen